MTDSARSKEQGRPLESQVPKSRLHLLDATLMLFLMFAVYHQTAVGDLLNYCHDLWEGNATISLWRPNFQRRNLAPLPFPLNESRPLATLPKNLARAASESDIQSDFLGTVAHSLGTCDLEDCRIPAPPYLSEVLGIPPTTFTVPVRTLAEGLNVARKQLYGDSHLALESLFLGVSNVRSALHSARIAGLSRPDAMEQHLRYLPSHIPKGAIETVRRVLANHRFWHLRWPVPNSHAISSFFGMRVHPVTGQRRLHNGMDIAAKVGTPVIAVQSGKVTRSGRDSLNGNYLKVNHGFGIETVYCHLESLAVGSGQRVVKGDVIGNVGETGRVTGPHLHFTLKLNNEPVDLRGYGWKPQRQVPRAGL